MVSFIILETVHRTLTD